MSGYAFGRTMLLREEGLSFVSSFTELGLRKKKKKKRGSRRTKKKGSMRCRSMGIIVVY